PDAEVAMTEALLWAAAILLAVAAGWAWNSWRGLVAREQKLRGKPQPDTFLAGARILGVDPAQAAVFEDALSGVAAGRAGGFGYVIGVDRVGQADELLAHGADVVVKDLADLLDAGDADPPAPRPAGDTAGRAPTGERGLA
ncbi:HAD-IA family hydrolase, partial [Micromonospora sp. NPDC049580]|uniref:HAD family hydrolase n=1 Tax=Micromonospora sp. NPDC049580 TaxID=3154832 RepID=UPI003431B9A1